MSNHSYLGNDPHRTSDQDNESANSLRISNRPDYQRRNPLSDGELQRRRHLSDGDILQLLPSPAVYSGDAVALMSCRYPHHQCTRQATRQTSGYCPDHFCELYRLGDVHIPEAVPDELRQTRARLPNESSSDDHVETRLVPGSSIQQTVSSGQNSPETNPVSRRRGDERMNAQDSRRQAIRNDDRPLDNVRPSRSRHERSRSASAALNAGNGSSSTSDEASNRAKKCSAPMCTRTTQGGAVLCSVCEDTLRRKKPEKRPTGRKTYICSFRDCKKRSNVKKGLCKECTEILGRENAKNVDIPAPQYQVTPHSSTSHRSRRRQGNDSGRDDMQSQQHMGQQRGVIANHNHASYEHQGTRPRTQQHRRNEREGLEERIQVRRSHFEQHAHGYDVLPSERTHQERNHRHQTAAYHHQSPMHVRQRREPIQRPGQRGIYRSRQHTYQPSEDSIPDQPQPALNGDESPPSSLILDTNSEHWNDDWNHDPTPRRNRCRRPDCEFFGDDMYNGYCSKCY